MLTGVLLFAPRATAASVNWIFQTKMTLLVDRRRVPPDHFTSASRATKPVAAATRRVTAAVGLLLWTGLALAGCAFILLE